MNKPELSLEFLNGAIDHIEHLSNETKRILGAKNPIADAVISMDLAGHSYDYSELIVMRDSLLNKTFTTTANTEDPAWNSPKDAIQSIRLAHEKMQLLDEERRKILKEHQALYGRDLYMEAQRIAEDGLGMPHRFIYDEYLEKNDITPVWAEKIWPVMMELPKQKTMQPERAAAINILDL